MNASWILFTLPGKSWGLCYSAGIRAAILLMSKHFREIPGLGMKETQHLSPWRYGELRIEAINAWLGISYPG